MGEFIEPFDFKTIYLDYFLGNMGFFIIALTMVISYACARFHMSVRNFAIILTLSALIFSAYLGQVIYILIIIVVGLITFKSIAGLITR